jgi:uncharacterized membrane protein
MAAFYLVAGIVHLVAPEKFLPIVPNFVPLPREVVLATGACEIAVMLALYAVLVFPANIKQCIEGIPSAANARQAGGTTARDC